MNISNRLVSILAPDDDNKISFKSEWKKGSRFEFSLLDLNYVKLYFVNFKVTIT